MPDGIRECFLRDPVDADLQLLAQARNRRREHGDHVGSGCRHRFGERMQALLEAEIAKQHGTEVAGELP